MTHRLLALLLCLPCIGAFAQALPPVPTETPSETTQSDIPDMAFGTHRYCKKACATVGFGVGTIRSDTPDKMKAFLVEHPEVKTLYLHGPGGELVSGLRLGVALRQAGINTALTSKMRCYSACAYAFLGGVEREVEDGGLLGLHQFSSMGHDVSEDDVQQAQALLETYMRGMGVPRTLLDLAARTTNSDIHLVDAEQARQLQMDNHGMTASEWTIGFPDSGGMAMSTHGRSYGSDREVEITMGAQQGLVGIATIFAEPPINSAPRRARETTPNQTSLIICRHDGTGPVNSKHCVVAQAASQWRNPKNRLYGVMFEVDAKEMGKLLDGSAADEIALGVWGGETGDDKVILLNTHANGFTQGIHTLLGK